MVFRGHDSRLKSDVNPDPRTPHIRQSRPDFWISDVMDSGLVGRTDFFVARGRDTRQEDVESLSTLRLEGSPTQTCLSPSIQRILRQTLTPEQQIRRRSKAGVSSSLSGPLSIWRRWVPPCTRINKSLVNWQPTGPNPLNHRDDFTRQALRHGSLNFRGGYPP